MQSKDAITSIDVTQMPTPTRIPTDETTVSQEEEVTSESNDEKEEISDLSKRFIPEHKKADAALTFPEKVSCS